MRELSRLGQDQLLPFLVAKIRGAGFQGQLQLLQDQLLEAAYVRLGQWFFLIFFMIFFFKIPLWLDMDSWFADHWSMHRLFPVAKPRLTFSMPAPNPYPYSPNTAICNNCVCVCACAHVFVFTCSACDCLSKCVVLCKYMVFSLLIVIAHLKLFLFCDGISTPYKYIYYYYYY